MFGTTRNTRDKTRKALPAKTLEWCKAGLNRTKSTARLYSRNEDGSLFIFGLFTFVIVVILAGVGVDIIRHETLRSELQSTTDRAVLAAANLQSGSTEEDAKKIVRDYFAKAGLSEYLNDVKVTGGGINGGRKVKAIVKATIPTYFMKFAGVNDLELTGVGAAQQGIADLEIALVLDVSGSMGSNNRLRNLKTAGSKFADTIFSNSQPGNVSISVVPYASQVNVGSTILSQVNRNDLHMTETDGSHCLNFSDADFRQAYMELPNKTDQGVPTNPGAKFYDQAVEVNSYGYNGISDSSRVCKISTKNRTLPYATTAQAVKDKINELSAGGNTSIELGVKWGAALLAPESHSFTKTLIETNEISDGNALRPKAFSAKTLKVMVVMTDGENTTQYVVKAPYRSGESDLYIDNGQVWFPRNMTSCSGWGWRRTCTTTNYYNTTTGAKAVTPPGRKMDWQEVWGKYSLSKHANYRESYGGASYNTWMSRTRGRINGGTKDARLNDICNAMKNMDVADEDKTLIFTIGFEAPWNGRRVLKSCASSASHYYDANGLDIADVFAAVATKITELRLVE